MKNFDALMRENGFNCSKYASFALNCMIFVWYLISNSLFSSFFRATAIGRRRLGSINERVRDCVTRHRTIFK